MLRARIVTALLLAPLAIGAILALPNELFAPLTALIVAQGAWEWSRLAGLRRLAVRLAYLLLFVVLLAVTYLLRDERLLVIGLVIAALIWWSYAIIWVARYPAGSRLWRSSTLARQGAGFLVLLPSWVALIELHSRSPELTLVLVLLAWGADMGAYFVGRRFGRHKLAPLISPGKSWEGVFGGLLLVLGTAVASAYYLPIMQPLLFIAVALMVGVFSVYGDLIESVFKRIASTKDSGGLLPGHGGVLDRIDSMTSAAPLFFLFLLLEWVEL